MARLQGFNDVWQLPLAVASGGLLAGPLYNQKQRKRVEEHGQMLGKETEAHLAKLRQEAELADQQLYDHLLAQNVRPDKASEIVGQAGSAKALEAAQRGETAMGALPNAQEEGRAVSEGKTEEARALGAQKLYARLKDEEKQKRAKDEADAEQQALIAAKRAEEDKAVVESIKASAQKPYVGHNTQQEEELKGERVYDARMSIVPPNMRRNITLGQGRAEEIEAGQAPGLAKTKGEVSLGHLQSQASPEAQEAFAQTVKNPLIPLSPGSALVPQKSVQEGAQNRLYYPERYLDRGQAPGIDVNIFGAPNRLDRGTSEAGGRELLVPGMPGTPGTPQFKKFRTDPSVLDPIESKRLRETYTPYYE